MKVSLFVRWCNASAATLLVLGCICIGGADAYALDRYFCDCGVGAAPGCVPGDDAKNGLTPESAKRTYLSAQQLFANVALFKKGDRIKFCRGGSFSVTNGAWLNGNCFASNDCTVEDYQPSSSSDSPKPLLVRNGDGMGIDLANSGNVWPTGGITFRNFDLRCNGCIDRNSVGVFMFNDVNNITFDGVDLTGWAIAFSLMGTNSASSNYTGNYANDNIVIRGGKISNCYRQGFMGSANALLIEHNSFLRNGGPSLLDHNIYLSGGNGVTVRNNFLYQSALDANGKCIGVSLVAHGKISNLLIEGNTVKEDVGKVGQGCWGIAVDTGYGTAEGFKSVAIRNNTVVNVGNVGIGTNACQDCIVENNIIIHDQDFEQSSIVAPNRARALTGDAADLPMERVTIRNNSILVGAKSGGRGVTLGGEGSGHIVVSNAIHYAGSASYNCLELGLPKANYSAVDGNVCGFPSATATSEWENGSGLTPNALAAWQKLSSFDLKSKLVIPGFVSIVPSSYDFHASSRTSAIVGAGHVALSSTHDITGKARGVFPDAGAFQTVFGSGSPPRAPTHLRVAP